MKVILADSSTAGQHAIYVKVSESKIEMRCKVLCMNIKNMLAGNGA